MRQSENPQIYKFGNEKIRNFMNKNEILKIQKNENLKIKTKIQALENPKIWNNN